jgi:hypothetical protein
MNWQPKKVFVLRNYVVTSCLEVNVAKLVRAVRQMQQSPHQSPHAELKKLQKRLAIIPPLAVTLLLSTEIFMVAAAQF